MSSGYVILLKVPCPLPFCFRGTGGSGNPPSVTLGEPGGGATQWASGHFSYCLMVCLGLCGVRRGSTSLPPLVHGESSYPWIAVGCCSCKRMLTRRTPAATWMPRDAMWMTSCSAFKMLIQFCSRWALMSSLHCTPMFTHQFLSLLPITYIP